MENSSERGILYTSYYGKLNSKAFFNFTGVIIAISRILPDDNRITREMQELRLAPSQKLFSDYKKCRISWIQYEEIFNNELDIYAIKELCDILDNGDNVLLLCYEKNNKYCHRRLIGDRIRDKGYIVKEL